MGSTNKTHETLPEPFPETPEAVESANWGDHRSATVPYEFDDGGFVVSFDAAGGRYEPLTGGWYYVPPETGTGEHEPWEDWYEVRGSYKRDERERRAIIMGRLNEQTGFWFNDPTTSSNAVPLRVAADGQKAIAAYLFAMHKLQPEAIAQMLDKSPQTIRQYLSDYKAGRSG